MTKNNLIPISLNLLKPAYWGAWCVVFIMWLISWLPLSTKQNLGKKLGRLLFKKMTSRTKPGRKNLKACFPEKSDEEVETLLEQNLEQMTIGALEAPHAWWRDMAPHAAKVNVIGLDRLLAAQAKGNGVLIMGGHFAAVDFIIPLFAAKVVDKHELAYMYRPHNNPVIDRMIVNGRNRHGVTGFTKRQLKDMIQYLKDGGMTWYGCDQNFGKSDLFAPFFGIQAANISTPSWIARESGAAVVFMRMHRLEDGNYEMEFSEELPPFGDNPQADCEAWNKELEKAILMHPSQYFWVHKRFKKRPPGEPSFY
jgi:KDO2-lipid IV(A) lauroyltransferase